MNSSIRQITPPPPTQQSPHWRTSLDHKIKQHKTPHDHTPRLSPRPNSSYVRPVPLSSWSFPPPLLFKAFIIKKSVLRGARVLCIQAFMASHYGFRPRSRWELFAGRRRGGGGRGGWGKYICGYLHGGWLFVSCFVSVCGVCVCVNSLYVPVWF